MDRRPRRQPRAACQAAALSPGTDAVAGPCSPQGRRRRVLDRSESFGLPRVIHPVLHLNDWIAKAGGTSVHHGHGSRCQGLLRKVGHPPRRRWTSIQSAPTNRWVHAMSVRHHRGGREARWEDSSNRASRQAIRNRGGSSSFGMRPCARSPSTQRRSGKAQAEDEVSSYSTSQRIRWRFVARLSDGRQPQNEDSAANVQRVTRDVGDTADPAARGRGHG